MARENDLSRAITANSPNRTSQARFDRGGRDETPRDFLGDVRRLPAAQHGLLSRTSGTEVNADAGKV